MILREAEMAKGYLVANIRVQDEEKMKQFSGMAVPVIEAFGGKVLARGPGAKRMEGGQTGVVMMIEFDSLATAEKFYNSDDYQVAKAFREEFADTDLMLIEGAE
jgi:uncharacterized protein (DUF1330 family)|tara:strand:+ start:3334 stop:3645 length:312 start_codon:yes stop_codon:yes gene_type:complete